MGTHLIQKQTNKRYIVIREAARDVRFREVVNRHRMIIEI